MKTLPSTPPVARPERPSTAVVHDEPNFRVIAFHLLPGQSIPPHHNRSTVMVQVISGSGTVHGDEGGVELRAGEAAVFRPGETHGIDAGGEALRFIALVAPRPGG
jgi:quercetin dioxygenase-like cupin family protein